MITCNLGCVNEVRLFPIPISNINNKLVSWLDSPKANIIVLITSTGSVGGTAVASFDAWVVYPYGRRHGSIWPCYIHLSTCCASKTIRSRGRIRDVFRVDTQVSNGKLILKNTWQSDCNTLIAKGKLLLIISTLVRACIIWIQICIFLRNIKSCHKIHLGSLQLITCRELGVLANFSPYKSFCR